MQAGARVRSLTYPEKGAGVVLGVQSFFEESFVDVFFEKTRERRMLPQVDLTEDHDLLFNMRSGRFSSAPRFLLRLLLQQVREESAWEGLQAAGNFKILPLPHQLLAVSFVLDKFKPRALIADEVGLGKTIEAALIYEELKARGTAKRILVIAPSGLCSQWREEMKTKFFEDFVIYDKDTVLSLKKLHGEETNVWSLADQIITSLDFVKPRKIREDLDERLIKGRQWHYKHVFEDLTAAGFDVVIIDEAHKLTKDMAGGESARYKVGKAMSEVAPVFLLLTATPHQGNSYKFRNLLHLIDPYLFYKNSDLSAENVQKVTVRNNKRAVVDFSGNRIFKQRITSLCLIERDAQKDLSELDLYEAVTGYVTDFYEIAGRQNNRTMMFLLLIYQRMVSSSSRAIYKSLSARLAMLEDVQRRIIQAGRDETVEDVNWEHLEDLPAEEQLVELQRLAGNYLPQVQTEALMSEIAVLKNCVALAQRASVGRNDVKFTKLLEIVDEFKIRENNPKLKFIIFTEFVETQAYMRDCLNSLGYSTALINGQMPSEERSVQQERFRTEAQFLISTDAGGEGINLQFCWVMIHYDLPWNPMRLEQRIGRIDRIGQEHDVKVVNFQLADTVEQRVRNVLESKLATIRREFNNGEDKLADILSTLQDEFNFEKIYIDALVKRRQDAAELEETARQIFDRAKVIIEEEQFALPFSNLDDKYMVSQHEIEKRAEKVQQLLELYLQAYGGSLNLYKQKPGLYHFQDPRTGKHMQNVMFQQKYALDRENCMLLSFNSPFMLDLLRGIAGELQDDTTAKLLVREDKFKGNKGFLFIYRLQVTNYIDPDSYYLMPCYVSFAAGLGRVNNRIAKYFHDFDHIRFSDLVIGEIPCDLEQARCLAVDAMRQRAETAFYEVKGRMADRLQDEEVKFEKFYRDKEAALNRIAVENIRDAKMKELATERKSKQLERERRRQVVPSLNLEQIAYVEFV